MITHINFLGKQLLWPTLIFYSKFSVHDKLMWPTLIFRMGISVGSKKLLWPTIIGLFSVVVGSSRSLFTASFVRPHLKPLGNCIHGPLCPIPM